METFLIKGLQLIMSLSLLVIIHEGGHFLFSRLFKVRVEKFYIFFDPWFSLFKFKPKNSDTEYGIGWVPLGGYVKIAGMIDESLDRRQMRQPVQPWEFRAKPAWQRLLIMVGGVLMNFLLAIFIYSMILFTWGDSYVSLQDMTNGMKFNERAREIGFCDGDILLRADDKPLERYNMDMMRNVVNAKVVTVQRDGQEKDIYMPELSLLDVAQDEPPFIDVLYPAVLGHVEPGAGFANVGVQKGDTVLAFDYKNLYSWNEMIEILDEMRTKAIEEERRHIWFTLSYGRATKRDTVCVLSDTLYQFGIGLAKPDYKVTHRKYGFFESFPAGIALGVKTLKGYVNDMKYVFTKEGAKSIGGFGTIGSIFPKTWDWHRFWEMTAFLSIILAFMNILPIPALDGGHLLFLLYEIVTHKKPNEWIVDRAQVLGMLLLLLLLLWANFNDVMRFFF